MRQRTCRAIVFAALLLTAKRLADRVGRRRVFFAGLVTILVASAARAERRPVVDLALFRVHSFAIATSACCC